MRSLVVGVLAVGRTRWELREKNTADLRKQRRNEPPARPTRLRRRERFWRFRARGLRTLRNSFDLLLIVMSLAHRQNISKKMSERQNFNRAKGCVASPLAALLVLDLRCGGVRPIADIQIRLDERR